MNHERYTEAGIHINKAIQYYRETNDSVRMGIAYMNQGNSRIYTEDYHDATLKYTEATNLVQKKQIPLLYAVSKTGIGISPTTVKTKYGIIYIIQTY